MGILRSRKIKKSIAKKEQVVTSTQLREIWKNSAGRNLQAIIVDKNYYAIPWELWCDVIEHTKIDAGQYRTDRYDCDDFAIVLKGVVSRKFALNSAGIVFDYSGGHAYTALLVANDDETKSPFIVFIEPQTDGLITNFEGAYDAEFGIAIF